jgi:hypothetical protein
MSGGIKRPTIRENLRIGNPMKAWTGNERVQVGSGKT